MSGPITTPPPTVEDLERLTKQNTLLMRALMRVKKERDDLAQQLAALQAATTKGMP